MTIYDYVNVIQKELNKMVKLFKINNKQFSEVGPLKVDNSYAYGAYLEREDFIKLNRRE